MAWQVAFAVFLIVHGLLHPAIYGPPPSSDAPWNTAQSWVLSRSGSAARRTVAVVLSVVTAVGYLFTGVALLVGADWWGPMAIIASVLSLVLLVGYFHPWLSLGVLLDVMIIWAALAGWPV
jgi:hypothetical protein